MIKVQVSFAGNANLEKVAEQLKELASNPEFEFVCCFLHRKHVVEKGFSPAIVDLLENTLGDRLTFMTERYETFDDVMTNINDLREETADLVNRLFILDSGTAAGVAKEIELFTKKKVILMP